MTACLSRKRCLLVAAGIVIGGTGAALALVANPTPVRQTPQFSTHGITRIPRSLSERAVDRTPDNTETLRDRSGTQRGPQLLDPAPRRC
jgi:hypothetical protein